MTIQQHIRALYKEYTEARAALDIAQSRQIDLSSDDYAKLDDGMIDAYDKLTDAIKMTTGLTSDELEKIR